MQALQVAGLVLLEALEASDESNLVSMACPDGRRFLVLKPS